MNKNNLFAALILPLFLLFSAPVFSGSVLSPLTDSVNSGIINTKMAMQDSLSSADVDATVVHGVAVFSGEVRSRGQIGVLIHIARSVSGDKRCRCFKSEDSTVEKISLNSFLRDA